MDYLKTRARFVFFVAQIKLREWGVYRFRLFIWIISGIIEPIVWSVLWYVVSSQTKSSGMSSAQVLTYYALVALVSRLTQSWTHDDLRKEIYEGKYSKYLLWPSSMVLYRLGLDLGNKVMNLVTVIPFWTVWVGLLVLNGQWVVMWPAFPAVMVSIVLAIVMKFLLDVVIAHLALWVERAEGISVLYNYAQRVCGGLVVPLMLLPDGVRTVCTVLPFRYVFSFPVEVMMGTTSGLEVARGFGIGLLWCFMLGCALEVLLRFGLPRYESVGI